jgi:hypothetical protein
MRQAKDHAHFFTATCLEWDHLLAEDSVKSIIVNSLNFLSEAGI